MRGIYSSVKDGVFMVIRKAVIPAAGLGTRFLPATKAQPKEMLPIVDKPAIQFVVEEAIKAGLSDILIITGRGKRATEDHFDSAFELEYYLREKGKAEELKVLKEVDTITSMGRIHFIRQGAPLGLGHAVLQAKDHIGNEPFVVLLGDDLLPQDTSCLDKMIEFYNETKSNVIALERIPMEKADSYGVIHGKEERKGFFKLTRLVEKPSKPEDKSDLAIMGRYVLNPEIFTALEHTKSDPKGEIQLTDALSELNKSQPIYGFLYEGIRWDIGNKLGFLKATVDYALQRDDTRDEFIEYLKKKLAK
jgi:UTP--glucose-1-phosphate uridylyltransferase